MKKNLNNESHHYFLILFLLIMQIDFLQEDNAVFYGFLYALYFLEKTKHLKQIFYYLFQAFSRLFTCDGKFISFQLYWPL